MFCPECGFDAEEARFCPDCGTSLDQIRAVASDTDVEDFDDEAGPVPGPAPHTTGSRGRTPARTSSSRVRAQRPRSGRNQVAAPAKTPARLSPAVIWMGFATLAVIVVIAAFAFTRTTSDASSTASGSGQAAGPIAADTSGAYTELVQRANGLYDQGAQAFQKKDQSTGAQYFTAAAKVYRAAWKQQATDPNVGTDYATSLFYSGDTAGALKQVNEVLAKSPDFQTAHLNKGVYLQTASQAAQQSGQKAKADSLLAQAKAEFQKAVAIDPSSSPGAKAAESLKSL
jgi:hypothetical protein